MNKFSIDFEELISVARDYCRKEYLDFFCAEQRNEIAVCNKSGIGSQVIVYNFPGEYDFGKIYTDKAAVIKAAILVAKRS